MMEFVLIIMVYIFVIVQMDGKENIVKMVSKINFNFK